MTTQQQLVIDQCKRNYDNLDRTSEHLDHKAFAIMLVSAVLAVISTEYMAPAGFVLTMAAALWALRPRDHKRVGDGEWDNYFNLYINRETDDAINQVLSNFADAITKNAAENESKARWVNLSMWMLACQVAGIALALLHVWG